MKLKRLFLSVPQEERDILCAAIIEAGICVAAGTTSFREFLKPRMLAMRGNSREYIKHFRRLNPAQQERFYSALTNYEDHHEL